MDDCTEDYCDPHLGCINLAVDCNDNDDSTIDDCLAVGGCRHTPKGEGEVDESYAIEG
jgi:hypothetical protein